MSARTAPKPTTLDSTLALAQKTAGWAFRECPPQMIHLRGNCTLIAVPPLLWKRRIGYVAAPVRPAADLVRLKPRRKRR